MIRSRSRRRSRSRPLPRQPKQVTPGRRQGSPIAAMRGRRRRPSSPMSKSRRTNARRRTNAKRRTIGRWVANARRAANIRRAENARRAAARRVANARREQFARWAANARRTENVRKKLRDAIQPIDVKRPLSRRHSEPQIRRKNITRRRNSESRMGEMLRRLSSNKPKALRPWY